MQYKLIDFYTTMFINMARIRGIKIEYIWNKISFNLIPTYLKVVIATRFVTKFPETKAFYYKMKISIILLLIAIIAISTEKCTSKYLLVDLDDGQESNRECKFLIFKNTYNGWRRIKELPLLC